MEVEWKFHYVMDPEILKFSYILYKNYIKMF